MESLVWSCSHWILFGPRCYSDPVFRLNSFRAAHIKRTGKLAETSKEVMDDLDSEFMLKDFYIPDYILIPGLEIKNSFRIPACPVIVFINSMSGGQLGGELLMTYRALLNENQVFDVGEKSPDLVLQQLYMTLGMLKGSGDVLANHIENHLRIIVAGGDGTASWLLGVVSDLKLPKPPPIATVPLGTGNNLPFSFGWGKKNPGIDQASVRSFLLQVKRANEMKIDSWHIHMKMKVQQGHYFDPVGPLDLPPSFHEFTHVFPEDKLQMDGWHTFRGGFWNYFSMGMDAQVSYSFHSERKLHPEKFKNQLTNQSIYVKLGCTQGWFCTPFYPPLRNIAQLVKVKIMKKQGQWEDLIIPTSIRAIVCLNLPSFSGGLDPWGSPNKKKLLQRELTPPYIDDGQIEIVGFRDAWHGLVLLTPKGHGTRLAQANRVLFEFKKDAANHTYMRIDGEPWKQPLDNRVIIEISHFGQMSMLANPHCRSKSIYDPSSPKTCSNDKEHSLNSAEQKKFSAASTFKFQNSIDKVENLS